MRKITLYDVQQQCEIEIELSDEDIQDLEDIKIRSEIFEKRTIRDLLLKESDWTQTLDAPVDREAWSIYRQALRDLPTHPDFPNVEFPEKP